MFSHLDPDRAFPEEVLAMVKRGIPLPTWYAGPIYQGNGSKAALEELELVRANSSAADASSDDDKPADF